MWEKFTNDWDTRGWNKSDLRQRRSFISRERIVPNGNIKSVEKGQENDFPLMVFWYSQSENGCTPLVDISWCQIEGRTDNWWDDTVAKGATSSFLLRNPTAVMLVGRRWVRQTFVWSLRRKQTIASDATPIRMVTKTPNTYLALKCTTILCFEEMRRMIGHKAKANWRTSVWQNDISLQMGWGNGEDEVIEELTLESRRTPWNKNTTQGAWGSATSTCKKRSYINGGRKKTRTLILP